MISRNSWTKLSMTSNEMVVSNNKPRRRKLKLTSCSGGPVVLTLFSAGVDKIPQVPFFSLPDVGSFTVDWIQGQLQGKDLCDLKVPYGVSA